MTVVILRHELHRLPTNSSHRLLVACSKIFTWCTAHTLFDNLVGEHASFAATPVSLCTTLGGPGGQMNRWCRKQRASCRLNRNRIELAISITCCSPAKRTGMTQSQRGKICSLAQFDFWPWRPIWWLRCAPCEKFNRILGTRRTDVAAVFGGNACTSSLMKWTVDMLLSEWALVSFHKTGFNLALNDNSEVGTWVWN